MENNYVLLFDENGQPYIAHSWLRKGETPKYKKKVENYYGPGKHLYLYTDREVRLFERAQEKARQKGDKEGEKKGYVALSAKIKDKLGWDERSAYEDAKKDYETAHNNLIVADKKYSEADEMFTKSGEHFLAVPTYRNRDLGEGAYNFRKRKLRDRDIALDKALDAAVKIDETKSAYDSTIVGKKDAKMSEIRAAQEERRHEANVKNAEKQVEKLDKEFMKWQQKNPRPYDRNTYTLDKENSITVRKQDLYDGYMKEIEERMSFIEKQAPYGIAPSDEEIKRIRYIMSLAEKCSQ